MNADAVWILRTLETKFAAELANYAASRKKEVARGAETSELAALLVEKFGYGLDKGLRLAADTLDLPAPNLITEVDRLVLEIDSEAAEHRKLRWASRPAGITRD